ncbi:DUF3054 domain-containing protein [Brevibacillus humidisoli]|uniref:DUF3054 domain-containing protein n=1 Tax=Brevibacillus humidisoli TaxID=2895522 RepID=UPI001E5788BC|nr:DUF3054 domain-containing protein [Brevibacillus humidisoli]UFJ42313.1 DUF3054 domain-containing protein [Brevibacillus humidisoli]
MGKTIVVILGDLLAFLLFAYIGKASHAHQITLLGIVETAAPFFLSWLFVGWLLKVFQPAAYQSVAIAAKKTLMVWLFAGIAGLALRSILLLHIPDWPFMVITMVTIAIFLLVWRTVFAWAVHRSR